MKETLSVSEAADKAQTIEDVILTYCEGNSHLEFDKENLSEMVKKITRHVADAVREDHNEHGGYVGDAIDLIEDMK